VCLVLLVHLNGCGSVVANDPALDAAVNMPTDAGADGALGADGAVGTDGGVAIARCDAQKPFAAPKLVANVNSVDDEIAFTLTRDELTGFVDHYVTGPGSSLRTTERRTQTVPFATPTVSMTSRVNEGNGDEFWPFPTADGLTLYFARSVAGSPIRVLATIRSDQTAAFAGDLAVTIDGMDLNGDQPVLSYDGETLYWVDFLTSELQRATRTNRTTFVDQLDISDMPVANPVLSADELTLYYSNGADTDVLISRRATRTASFGDGVPVAVLNTTAKDAPVFLTPDDCVLYLKSDRPGGIAGLDIWAATRPR
jgi:hypothetical protein